MTSAAIRKKLGMSRSEWARVLGVHTRTVTRWEEDGRDPAGLTSAVMGGIATAVEEARDLAKLKSRIRLGIAAVIGHGLSVFETKGR